MTLDDLNILLAEISKNPGRETVFNAARFLVRYMGLHFPGGEKEQGILPNKQELKKYLVPNPLTRQGLLFRFTAKGQNAHILLGVLKKFRKDQLTQLIDKENLICFQRDPPVIQGTGSAGTYLIYLVTTESFDRLYVILFNENQKRIISLRNKLTPTQFNKILPQWENIGQKSKPEIAAQLWKSLDLKEVNKEFYKEIKQQFDALVEIAIQQAPKTDEKDIKQFAVRLIGRYIFCWFLKEKGIIPDDLLGSEAVKDSDDYLKNVLQPLFFKTLNTPVPERDFLKSADSVLQKLEVIPYLNGGLFDRHAEDNLFSQLKLNDWLYSFVEVLENFDFTVDESSSQYQLVSIDPEMLGKIFENLLASQNEETEKLANQRKAYGAFYTPREIVDYMVNESLKAHLETHLLPKDPIAESSNRVEEPAVAYKGTLFQQLEPQQILIPFGNKEKIEAADRELKRKNLQTKIDKLFAVGCTDNPFDKDETPKVRKLLSEITVLDPACGSGAFPMGMMLRLMELRQIVGHGYRNNYDLKSEILSKNIYGVDIMSMAVEIARLRAWLSLVLEADYKPQDKKNNFGIAALPNLDFKFICANSLIDSGYDAFLEKVRFNATLYRMDGEIQKLERLREEYYDPKGDKTKKKDLQNEFYKTKTYIKTEFDGLKKAWKLEDFLSKVDDWDPFDDGKPSSFFSPAWMFGIREGFDVVIGNPPYVQLQKGIYNKQTYPYSEGKDKGKQNLYKIFVEAGYNFIKGHGIVCVIVQSSLLCDLSSTHTRELLLTNTELREIIEYPKNSKSVDAQVFDSVLQGTCSLIFIKRKPSLNHLIRISVGNDILTIKNLRFENILQLSLKDLYPDTYYIPLVIEGDSSVLKKIVANSATFEPYIKSITQGDLNLTSSSNQFSTYKTIVKLYRGRNIHKYKLLKNVDEYVNPLFKAEQVAENRKCTFIVMQEITGTTDKYRLHACFTDKYEKFLFGHTANKILLKDERLNKITLGLLNSKLLDWFFRKTSTNNHVMGYEIKQLPIPKKIENKNERFSNLVNEVILKKGKHEETEELEKEIDVLVYKLYNLTYEEVRVVDKDFWMGEEEYKSFKVQ